MENKYLKIYESSYNYLLSILPEKITEKSLQNYFLGDNKNCKTLSDIFERFVASAQNYQRMPNVIKFFERKEKFREILFDFDIQQTKLLDAQELYYFLRKEFNVTSKDSKMNSWLKWSNSIVDSAKFLSEFSSVEDFNRFVNLFSYNVHTRMALPLLMSSKIKGIGFALACDILKELGFEDYPKPDVHLIEVFSGIGMAEKTEVAIFEFITKMADECRKTDKTATAYKIDKIIWLICSGRFYLHNIEIGRHKQELIELLKNE